MIEQVSDEQREIWTVEMVLNIQNGLAEFGAELMIDSELIPIPGYFIEFCNREPEYFSSLPEIMGFIRGIKSEVEQSKE